MSWDFIHIIANLHAHWPVYPRRPVFHCFMYFTYLNISFYLNSKFTEVGLIYRELNDRQQQLHKIKYKDKNRKKKNIKLKIRARIKKGVCVSLFFLFSIFSFEDVG